MLAVRADEPFDALPWIAAFSERCRSSREHQGDGWGVAWREGSAWRRRRSVRPIWDDVPVSLPRSRVFLVHARSAFRNEGVVERNNMPFLDGEVAFAFNGELRGVRLAAPGDTGAAKLLHLFVRFRRSAGGDGLAALARLDSVVTARTDYVRALNVVASDGRELWVNAHHSEDPAYFTMVRADVDTGNGTSATLIASEPLRLAEISPTWLPIPNRSSHAMREAVPC